MYRKLCCVYTNITMFFFLKCRYEKFETTSKNGVNSELFIRNVDRRDGALYSCSASNNYGSDERNIKVLVVGKLHQQNTNNTRR